MTHPQGEGIAAPAISVERLCAAAAVSRASYYRSFAEKAPRLEQIEVRHQVQLASLAWPKWGARRITALLGRQGWRVNHKRVERIRQEDNLLCLKRSPFKPATTNSRHSWVVWPNLAWRLELTDINQLWVADITYVRLAEAFVYLAVILDAFSRKAVGWAMADHLRAELALGALEMALASRQIIPGGLVHHSDRGLQYACGDYLSRLQAAGIHPSMSRVGCPYDNAQAESFMATLKREEVDGRRYRDLAHAKAEIGRFIETVYNRQRLHSALDYLSPEEFEISHQRLWTAIPQPTPQPPSVV